MEVAKVASSYVQWSKGQKIETTPIPRLYQETVWTVSQDEEVSATLPTFTHPHVYPHVYLRDSFSQAFPLRFCILQVIKNWRLERPGDKATFWTWGTHDPMSKVLVIIVCKHRLVH